MRKYMHPPTVLLYLHLEVWESFLNSFISWLSSSIMKEDQSRSPSASLVVIRSFNRRLLIEMDALGDNRVPKVNNTNSTNHSPIVLYFIFLYTVLKSLKIASWSSTSTFIAFPPKGRPSIHAHVQPRSLGSPLECILTS